MEPFLTPSWPPRVPGLCPQAHRDAVPTTAGTTLCGLSRSTATVPWELGPLLWVRTVLGELPSSKTHPDHSTGSCGWWAQPPPALLGTPILQSAAPPSSWGPLGYWQLVGEVGARTVTHKQWHVALSEPRCQAQLMLPGPRGGCVLGAAAAPLAGSVLELRTAYPSQASWGTELPRPLLLEGDTGSCPMPRRQRGGCPARVRKLCRHLKQNAPYLIN